MLVSGLLFTHDRLLLCPVKLKSIGHNNEVCIARVSRNLLHCLHDLRSVFFALGQFRVLE